MFCKDQTHTLKFKVVEFISIIQDVLFQKSFFITSHFYKHISQGGFDDQQTVNPTFSDNTTILPTPHVLSKYLLLLEVYL